MYVPTSDVPSTYVACTMYIAYTRNVLYNFAYYVPEVFTEKITDTVANYLSVICVDYLYNKSSDSLS